MLLSTIVSVVIVVILIGAIITIFLINKHTVCLSPSVLGFAVVILDVIISLTVMIAIVTTLIVTTSLAYHCYDYCFLRRLQNRGAVLQILLKRVIQP